MNATAMEYTIIIVSTKAVKSVQEHFNGLDNREWAERYAEGITHGLHVAGKNCGVIMLPNGEFTKDTITKDCFGKHMDVFYKWCGENGKL